MFENADSDKYVDPKQAKVFGAILVSIGNCSCVYFHTISWATDFKWILFWILIISSSVSDWFASNSLEFLVEISAMFKFCSNGLLIKD